MQSDNLNLPVKLPVSSSELIKKLDEWRVVYKHFTHEPLMTVKESKSIQARRCTSKTNILNQFKKNSLVKQREKGI